MPRSPRSPGRSPSRYEQMKEAFPSFDNFGPANIDRYRELFSTARASGASGLQRWYQWLSISWDTKLVGGVSAGWDDLVGESSVPLPPSRFVYEELRAPLITVLVCAVCYWYNPTYAFLALLCGINLFYWLMRGQTTFRVQIYDHSC